MDVSQNHLSRSLGPFSLWGLGVGYVISGMYFGWNLGLPRGGTFGFSIALCIVAIMFICFTLSYCELACAFPKAGGAFNYATSTLGSYWGFLAGMAQIIEFVFAPPAIASAIGSYVGLFLPNVSPLYIAITAYFLFTALNIYGVKTAALFELLITLIAVFGIIVFVVIALPHFNLKQFSLHPWPHGLNGIFLTLPFAMWFFLGIEGIANLAEETINPKRNIFLGFGATMVTLTILSFLTFVSAVGVGGWEKIVTTNFNSPLPSVLNQITNSNNFFYHLLIVIGLIGLIASFHGIILAAGRVTFEFGRLGYVPSFLGQIYHQSKTPIYALIINMIIGISALFTGKTDDLITIACFGACCIYILSMCSLLKLRKKSLPDSFRVPFYPFTPLIALSIACLTLFIITICNLKLAAIYFGILFISFLWFIFFVSDKTSIIIGEQL